MDLKEFIMGMSIRSFFRACNITARLVRSEGMLSFALYKELEKIRASSDPKSAQIVERLFSDIASQKIRVRFTSDPEHNIDHIGIPCALLKISAGNTFRRVLFLGDTSDLSLPTQADILITLYAKTIATNRFDPPTTPVKFFRHHPDGSQAKAKP